MWWCGYHMQLSVRPKCHTARQAPAVWSPHFGNTSSSGPLLVGIISFQNAGMFCDLQHFGAFRNICILESGYGSWAVQHFVAAAELSSSFNIVDNFWKIFYGLQYYRNLSIQSKLNKKSFLQEIYRLRVILIVGGKKNNSAAVLICNF